MSRLPAAPYYQSQLAKVARAASALFERVECNGATSRDLAIAIELNQKYVDILDEILSSEIEVKISDAERRILYS
jgi:hypothetical protein